LEDCKLQIKTKKMSAEGKCIPREVCYCKHESCLGIDQSSKFDGTKYVAYHGFLSSIALGKVPKGLSGTVYSVDLPAGSEGDDIVQAAIKDGKLPDEKYIFSRESKP
jgi:hypothetical protein